MTISFYKGLKRNSENGNIPSDFCPLSGDWDELGLPNLTRTNAAKCQSHSFYRLFIKEQPRGGGGGKTTPLHPD